MQLRLVKNIVPPSNKFSKIQSMCWSPNNRRLAVADSDGVVHLFDENGDRRDKFPTKSNTGQRNVKTYLIKGMTFSPDNMKLAIAQSDNIVFVYKLGLEWGDKKSICNKFANNSSVTCLCWPYEHVQDLVFGLADGRVKIGNLKSNKTLVLYSGEAPVVCIAASNDGHGIVSAHLDGSIYRYYFMDVENEPLAGRQKIAQYNGIPQCITFAGDFRSQVIIVAGNDNKIFFYSRDGTVLHYFDYSTEDKEISAITTNPSGQSLIVGSFNRLRTFNYNIRKGIWEEGQMHNIPNYYTITSIEWKPDGSRCVIGTLTGAVDMYDTFIRKYRHKNDFEFTYVSPSQVIVTRLSSGTRIELKSLFNYEILKVRVAKDQFLVGHTPSTLLLGDLESCKLSEVPWNGSGNEKFFFDNPRVCMVYNAGEISIIEYGINDAIGSFRTEHVKSHLISVRISETNLNDSRDPFTDDDGNKKVAYLIDSHTIRILDLANMNAITVPHFCKIDWLELNYKATKLLFRDKQRALYLYDMKTQKKVTLLPYCNYVQWVPDSDVVVAQNRGDLCVWYSIDSPERCTVVPIKGEVEDIIRTENCTAVIVDEGTQPVNYDLDEGLIAFGTAMENKEYERAADILDSLSLTPETEAMWRQLSVQALEDQRIHIAERCFAALGDVAKTRYLNKICQDAQELESENMDPLDHWKIKARMSILAKRFKEAEQIYLEQGKVLEAMRMYEQVHKFEESIALAIQKGIPDAQEKKAKYIKWLIDTKQEDKAAKIFEKDGQYSKAITLYLQGGFPASAAALVHKHKLYTNTQLLDPIATALSNAGLHEKAGEFYEKRQMYAKAIEEYRKGHAYSNAISLARQEFPDRVVDLELEYGEYCLKIKQYDNAITHFVEGGDYIRAVEAAITNRRWEKACTILDAVGSDEAVKYYLRIAKHYEEVQNFKEAKNLYLRANKPELALKMFEKVQDYEQMESIAVTFYNQEQLQDLYFRIAQQLENKNKYKEAEMYYIKAKEEDMAINMYKNKHLFDDMIRLVSQYRSDLLKDAHRQIASQYEIEGNFTQASHHYIQSGDWQRAVEMYKNADKWNDAIRIVKAHGKLEDLKAIANKWAVHVGGEAGAKLLFKLDLISEAIEFCEENGLWNVAFEMAKGNKQRTQQVHMKYAMNLEVDGKFREAEEEYINAGSPREAILMYIEQKDWNNAMRVAETYSPNLVNDVLIAQAKYQFDQGQFQLAEQLFIRARKPDLLVEKYKLIGNFEDAKRIAKQYLYGVDAEREITTEWAVQQIESEQDPVEGAKKLEQIGKYNEAIDAYLKFDWKRYAPDYLEREWMNAVKLALNSVQNRVPEVVATISSRLVELKRFESAAQLNLKIEDYGRAIDIYIKAQMFEDAFKLANIKKEFLPKVQEAFKQHLQGTQDATIAKLEMLAKSNDWDGCMKLAKEKKDETLITKYATKYVNYLIDKKEFINALNVLNEYSIKLENEDRYIVLAKGIFNDTSINDIGVYELLKSILSNSKKLEKYHIITHYILNKLNCLDMKETYTKICQTLLKYTNILPADITYYEAGMAAQQIGWKDMAFVLLNRFLDIEELIDGVVDGSIPPGSMRSLDNSDFIGTEIPFNIPIPDKHTLDPDTREEINSLCVEASLDANNEGVLKTMKCENCKVEMYAGNLKCTHCGKVYEECVITGFPVLNKVQCTNCKKSANRDDWNLYITKHKHCPWCNDYQSTMY